MPAFLPSTPAAMDAATWGIAGLATAGVITRPFRWPEAVWAVTGAALLVLLGLLTPGAALAGIARGTDVYLFLIGMMVLAELARQEGLFDWLAALATRAAAGSANRLFLLVYAVGTLVTVFLSNDATAVVLTPAVYAACRAARVRDPLPYLFVCAFIANAASFVLPISNPANLVVFGPQLPPLGAWLARFALPSALAILATYLGLRLVFRRELAAETVAAAVERPRLSVGGRLAGLGIAVAAVILAGASALGHDLGLPTLAAGLGTAALILLATRKGPGDLVRHVSWSVLPLVAGLFVLVEALERTGLIRLLAGTLRDAASGHATATAWGAGLVTALACNLLNNLPAGLIAGSTVQAAGVPDAVTGAVLIGVDLGPNLSVTGSLATILWLAALRREGEEVGAWRFLKVGLAVTPPALVLAIGALVALG
jgi:arsenical pump membrane protein